MGSLMVGDEVSERRLAKLKDSFIFLVVVLSLLIFPASNLTGVTNLYIGWLAWIFIVFICIGVSLLVIRPVVRFIEKYGLGDLCKRRL